VSPVKDADPSAVALDQAFAVAMDTPGAPREPGPPPEVDNDAPHGRDEDGAPLAPYGLTRDGKPKRSPAGRKPAAADKARVTAAAQDQAPEGNGAGAGAAPGKWAPGIAEALETLWLGGTMIGTAGTDLPVVGRLIPGVQLQAQAAVILTFKDSIATALDLCAQHNASARRLAEKMAAGDVGWALTAMFMVLPVVSTSLQVWGRQEPEYHPETGEPLPTLAEQLAESNKAAFQQYMDKLAKQAEALAQEKAPAGQAALCPSTTRWTSSRPGGSGTRPGTTPRSSAPPRSPGRQR
jgi:hypothetical protein